MYFALHSLTHWSTMIKWVLALFLLWYVTLYKQGKLKTWGEISSIQANLTNFRDKDLGMG